jgi:hypothetical protein
LRPVFFAINASFLQSPGKGVVAEAHLRACSQGVKRRLDAAVHDVSRSGLSA